MRSSLDLQMRAAFRAALLLSAFASALLVTPTRAWAHGQLKSSNPAAGSRLMTAPRILRLMFTEDPALAFTSISLEGPNGSGVQLGPVAIASDSRRAVVATALGAMRAGSYTVIWTMAGTMDT